MAERNSKGQFAKGHKSFWSDVTRKKMSEIAKKNGFGKVNLGKKLSEDTKRKIRENSARYWLGKKRSPETIEKIRIAKTGKPTTSATKFKKGNIPATLGKTGKNHPAWKEEKRNPLRQAIRQLFQYREWRLSVFKEDHFTCTFCKKKEEVSGKLEADHYPKSFAEIIANINSIDEAINCEELWDTSNGRTLCENCHKETDNYMWKARMK